jgi:hypothetical protein
MNTHRCNVCNQEKPIIEFYIRKKNGKPYNLCRVCWNLRGSDRVAKNRAYITKYNREYCHRTGRSRAAETARDSPVFLGVVVAERALSKFFDHIERMPYKHPGYDFICGKGFKIDSKSSCIRINTGGYRIWRFSIHKNKVADYFIFLAFDSRENLEPRHVWLVPGSKINSLNSVCISDCPSAMAKWAQYEKPLDKVVACCNEMKTCDLSIPYG